MNQVRQTRDAELTFFRERTGSRQDMVESEFVLLYTEIHDSGIPWALLPRERGGELEFAGPRSFGRRHMSERNGPRSSQR